MARRKKRGRRRKPMKRIKLTPTWSGLMPWMCAVLQNPKAPAHAKAAICTELKRLASKMDEINRKAGRK